MSQLKMDKFLDDDEFDSLMRDVTADPITRNKLLIQLALSTGARASELLNVTQDDLKPRSVYIRGLKGSSDREIPIRRELVKELLELPVTSDKKIFPISYQRLYQIWLDFAPRKPGGRDEKTFHCLRHTFAVRLYKKTRDVKAVQLALGHKDLRNTMIYVDFVYSQEHLQKVMGV